MDRFSPHQVVRVIDPDHPLHGMEGTVRRLNVADAGAWVEMHREIPDGYHRLNDGTPEGERLVQLYPQDCARVRK